MAKTAATPTAERDPMDRLAVVEKDLEQERARSADLAAKVATLEAIVETHKQAEAARVAHERETYVASLQHTATKVHGTPIPADDLALVRDAFERGDDKSARALGRVLLERSQAQGKPAQKQASVQPLAGEVEDRAAAVKRGTAILMQAAGFGEKE